MAVLGIAGDLCHTVRLSGSVACPHCNGTLSLYNLIVSYKNSFLAIGRMQNSSLPYASYYNIMSS